MTSSRPYLVRALYEWITDNKLTPYILLDTNFPEVFVPKDYVNEGRIVLNVSPEAIHGFLVSNSELEFHASFGGRSHHISAPIVAILGIYAQENGEGMFFGSEPGGDTPPDNSKFTKQEQTPKKPFLKIVKSD